MSELILVGYLNGLTAMGVLIINLIFGSYTYYKSRKLKARLLSYAGLMIVFIGLLWLGPTTDFLTILLTGNNLAPKELYPILSYMWIAPAVFFAMYIGSELLFPEKKRYVVAIFLILGIIFEIFLFLTLMGIKAFEYDTIIPPGSTIIDTSFVYGSVPFILIAVFILSVFLLCGIGSLRKSLQSTGVIRRKFLFLALGFIVFAFAAIFDSLIPPGPALPVVRIAVISSGILMYLGLKT